ncbi:unnamed protein product (macronuclear) [Paramecium tetraurelia]|uniref:Uncharacterized protein n=1 Tax=Paramecium tetraurelia TaxID=5888 RepID=A0CPM8_PARTE|nr:uncharacterized protein GSPATT00009137001 [Paramecium tetraurelia]CAK72745.1 unnamed protein product [Paramecium tetraurelia]|eukprot:XP_001440142.1 hypothetical protein (macronuclear) [Paramecium tetraurelia strain d4-2]
MSRYINLVKIHIIVESKTRVFHANHQRSLILKYTEKNLMINMENRHLHPSIRNPYLQKRISKQGIQSIYNSNPSFDLLQTKLKEFSNKKSISPLKSRVDQNSPKRVSGIQQQISKIGTLNFTLPSKQMRIGSFSDTLQFNGSISEDRRIYPVRLETEVQEKLAFSQKPITNMIPLHEIMNMRNKLENAQLNVNQISSAYTSEMVKLASVINSQLKKKSK